MNIKWWFIFILQSTYKFIPQINILIEKKTMNKIDISEKAEVDRWIDIQIEKSEKKKKMDIYIYIYTGWNDKIVAPEKTTIPFLLNENCFLFFVADHLLVGQLCTNPKSNKSLLSGLNVTQCSMSDIGDAPLYNSCSLPIQVPSKCKSGLPRITGTCQGDENKVSGYGYGLWCGF